MKRKFSSMGRVAIALVLALSLSLVMAVPVGADVSVATVTVTPTKISQAAKYEVQFNITASLFLEGPSTISITFPALTTVPDAYDGTVTVDATVATVNDVDGKKVIINVPQDILAPATVTVVLDKDGDNDIINPSTAADYTLTVKTSAEVEEVESNPYTITPPTPTIAAVGPPAANQGEVLDVCIDGANFLAGATVSFSGAGISVDEVSVVDATHLIATITIASDAATTIGNVTVTTIGGASVPFADAFTVKDAETTLVDIYDAPGAGDLFDAGWLDYSESQSSITAGIAAIDGSEDTIVVHAADYDLAVEGGFPILVNETDLTIKSYMGDDYTTIDGSASTAAQRIVLDVNSAGVTIDGFTIIGSKYTTPFSEWGIYLRNTGFTVQNNTITDVTFDSIFVNSNHNAIALGLIDNNILIGMGSDASLGTNGIRVEDYGNNISGVTLSNNIVSNYGEAAVDGLMGNGIKIAELVAAGTVTDITVKDNDISGCYTGLVLWGTITGLTDAKAIADNTISGCHTGILVTDKGGTTECDSVFDLVNNTIIDNTAEGIWFMDSDTPVALTGAKTIEYNDIHGNGTYGILNDFATSTDDPDARYNYWGEIGGPSAHADATEQTALGNGNAISDNVTYHPWLSVSYETVVADGIRYYGSDTLKLQPGWNTLSVPVELYDLANTLTEIRGLGGFLDDIVIAYAYDTATEDWVVPQAIYELELTPGQGYYIKMAADMDPDTSFPVIYSNQLGLPALELAAGWNLIGSAFGIDKLSTPTWAVANPDPDANGDPGDAVAEAWMEIKFALDSIGAQVSVVVSPSAPGQLGDPWSLVWTNTSNQRIYPGEGYWVFMTDTGTLAGFEITPFYFTP